MFEPPAAAQDRAEAAWLACAGDALSAGNDAAAAARWAEALRIARLELPPGHPFLLPSLVQHALRLVEHEPATARSLLSEAIACAHRLMHAAAALPVRPTARSSTFHLRLEAKHRVVYAAGRRRVLDERLDGVVALLESLRADPKTAVRAPEPTAPTAAASTLELALACLPRPATA